MRKSLPRRRMVLTVGCALGIALAVSWVLTGLAERTWLRMVRDWDEMDATERRSFYADRVQAGGRWHDTSGADFTGPDAKLPEPGPQTWYIDLVSPFVRYQYVDQAMGFRAAKWRLGLTGWRIEEHFFYG